MERRHPRGQLEQHVELRFTLCELEQHSLELQQQHWGSVCGRGHCQTPSRSAVSMGQQAGANQVPAIKSSFGKLMAEWWQWQGVAHRNLPPPSNRQEISQFVRADLSMGQSSDGLCRGKAWQELQQLLSKV